jgi:glutaredoxin-related protein
MQVLQVLKEVRVSLVMLNTDGDDPKETDESDNDSSTVRLVALQHDETQRMPTVGTKQHLIAKDNACVFENSPEVAEEKSTHCLKKVIEMQQDKCQELGLVETNTFLAITAVLQDDEKDILVSKYNKHTLVAKQSLASLVLLELATMT